MPGCPYGAETKPELVGFRTWVNADTLDFAVQTFLNVVKPDWRLLVAAQLVDFVDLCELNPSPPPPFDVKLLLEQTQPTVFGPATPVSALAEWISQWVQYQAFLANCVCKLPPLDPAHNCTNAPPSFVLGPLNSTSAAFPVTVDQVVLDSIVIASNGDWRWAFSGSAVIDGGAFNGHDLFIEYQLPGGAWQNTSIDLRVLNEPPEHNTVEFRAEIPKFTTTTAVRILNRAGASHTIDNFVFCFEPMQPFPEPQPDFDEPDNVPPPPAPLCSTADLCAMITEINRRLTVIGAQVSDLNAAIGGRDELQVISSQSIGGEGEATLALGTRAVSVELTDLSDEAFTSALGRPRGLMRVGSLRYGDGVGYSPRRFIDADRFDDVPPLGALSVSWQLLPPATAVLKFLG